MSFDNYASITGVCVAFNDDALTEAPLWTRLDEDFDNYVSLQSFSIDRGRNSELDSTGPGTATVTFIDRNGTFDPTNSAGDFYGKLNPMKQAGIALYNPVTDDWHTLFRGFVAEWSAEIDVSAKFLTVTLELVDGFGFLAKARMTPGVYGATPADVSEGEVVFEGEPDDDPKHVNSRINDALTDVGWPLAMRDIFSGNVTVRHKVYDRGDEVTTVITDAADSEHPFANNFYFSKTNMATFRGRYSRFNPTNPDYNITTYDVGFQTQVSGSTAVVPISSFGFRRSDQDIINGTTVSWFGMPGAVVDSVTSSDATSIGDFGFHTQNVDDLLTYQGHDDDNNTTSTATELKKFADFIVDNYKDPKTRLTTVGFRPRAVGSANAAALWSLLCNIELSDRLQVVTTHPGGGGFNEPYFVEGIHYDADIEGGATFTNVTLTLDVSPASFFNSNPFGNVDGSIPHAITSLSVGASAEGVAS